MKSRTKKNFFSDETEVKALIEAGKISAKKAIKESKAMNLSITYLEGDIIYRESPDGKREKIGNLK
jgi:hypothetical protein